MNEFKCNNDGLYFVFDELNRKNKPCINLKDEGDAVLLANALNFANENCIKLDGCCSSRVHTSLSYLKNVMNPPPITKPDIDKMLKNALSNNCIPACCGLDD